MIDPLTREEAKEAIIQYVIEKGVARLEDLVSWYAGILKGSLPPVQTLLAELLMEKKLTEKKFRRSTVEVKWPIQFLYFPADTFEAHPLQSEMVKRVQYRPANFQELSPDQQWEWDKALGILDYEGK
jgi:hypothetical protein